MRLFGSVFVVLVVAGLATAEDVGTLVKQLQSRDVAARREAAQKLSESGKDAKDAIPALTTALGDKDKFVRRFAAKALGNMGEEAKGSINALKGLLDDEQESVADAAVDALGRMGLSALPVLCKLVEDDKQAKQRRRDVCKMIADMKPAEVGSVAVPMLIKLLKDKDNDIKMDAIGDLGRYGAEAKSAVPQLADMLKPNDNNVRRAVMNTLGQLGPEAKAALPALQALRDSDKDQDKNFKKPAEETIKKIEGSK
jgi:HEAT repeat protein